MSLEPGRLLMCNCVSDVTQIVPPDRLEVSCPPLATVQSGPRSRPIRARHSGGGVTAKTNQRREQSCSAGDGCVPVGVAASFVPSGGIQLG